MQNSNYKMIKILTVDDSRIFRSFIKKAIDSISDATIIGTAYNGVKAMEFLNDDNNEIPDIITLDIEMPEMNGFETLQAINDLKKERNLDITVIMMSSLTQHGADETLRALRNGAFDFIPKPKGNNPDENLILIKNALSNKIIAHKTKKNVVSINLTNQDKVIRFERQNTTKTNKFDAILIGVSTGGPEALDKLMPELTKVTNLPIMLVQHMPKGFIDSLAAHLNKVSSSEIMKGFDGQIISEKEVYIAPGDKHMLIKKVNDNLQISLNEQKPVNGCIPSIDVLFRSALTALDGKVIAIVLTGMGNDGAKGASSLKRKGAHIIAQNEQTSVVWGIPKKTIETGCVDKILPLMEIPKYIEKLLNGLNKRI